MIDFVRLARWPKKSALVLLEVLKNAESNALYKNLNINEIFIDKIGRVFIETRYCQNKVRSRATHDVVQPRPRTFTSVFGTRMGPYTGMAVASRIVLQRVQQLSPSKCITHCPPIKQPQASSPQLSRQSRRSSKR